MEAEQNDSVQYRGMSLLGYAREILEFDRPGSSQDKTNTQILEQAMNILTAKKDA